jgi:hypothetical protein
MAVANVYGDRIAELLLAEDSRLARIWNRSNDAIHAALLLRALIEQWTDRRRCNDEKHHECDSAPLLRDIPTHQ